MRIFLSISALIACAYLIFPQNALADEYEKYRSIQNDLASARVRSSTLENVIGLFPEAKSLREYVSSAKSTDPENLMGLRQKAQKAYIEFVNQPANAGVLYGFIQNRLSYLEKMPKEKLPGAQIAWSWSYLSEAAVLGYEATGDVRFIEIALKIFRHAYANIDSALGIKEDFGRADVEGWAFEHYGKVARETTLAGRILSPMLRLRIATKNAKLPSSLESEIEEFSSHAVSIIRSYLKYQIIKGDERYFIYIFTGEDDAFNHIAAYASATAYAYKVTGDKDFYEFTKGFINYFIKNVNTDNDGAFSWPYQVFSSPGKQYVSLLWKEAITVSALLDAQDEGIALPKEARAGLIRMFTKYVLRPSRAVNARIGPVDFPLTGYNLSRSDFTNVQLFTHYLALDRFAPKIRKDILETIAVRPDLFPDGLLSTFSSATPYAYMLRHP